ncbi:MAG TPA: peptidoglycan DD-metalloendopeptidase family protein [Burkholderiales bacterium]|nr:peptidoglycan DD-metalloendopeptidase family protein [Burkholderiales bacterium]
MRQAESAILAQKLLGLVHNGKLRRLILIATLPFAGVMAAFGIAPDTVTEHVTFAPVVQELSLPEPQAAEDSPQSFWREERIQRGDTIGTLLARLGIDDPEAAQFLRNAREARSLYRLAPGRMVRAETTAEGRLVSLHYLHADAALDLQRTGDSFRITEQAPTLERRVLMKSGEIRSSLFAATDAAQLPDAIATQLADIFSTDIDFHKDLRRGDHFTVVYEMFYDHGESVKSGRVVAAEFVNQDKTYQAVWFKDGEAQGGYYTPEGKNIRKAFLRSPLEFSRVSSGFSNARYHPILQEWRAHRGIDYAAPVGTGVKATADGVVEFASRYNGYGNLIVIRHQSKYTTWYGHLSAFARGIRKGARVSQGTVIGYVGATGLATGPHLHYEFRINDVHQNPLRVVMPEAPPITPERRAAFETVAKPLAERLTLLRTTNLARLD